MGRKEEVAVVHGRSRSGEQRHGGNLGCGNGVLPEEEWCRHPGNCWEVADRGWLEGEMDRNCKSQWIQNRKMNSEALLGWSTNAVRVQLAGTQKP